MVTALYGKCQGQDVRFTRNEAGRWETAVPASPNGAYIMELWAEDQAGNQGYFATIKLAYDPNKLCCTVEVLDIGAGFTVEDVRRILMGGGVETSFWVEDIQSAMWDDPLKCDIVRCEVCGR